MGGVCLAVSTSHAFTVKCVCVEQHLTRASTKYPFTMISLLKLNTNTQLSLGSDS